MKGRSGCRWRKSPPSVAGFYVVRYDKGTYLVGLSMHNAGPFQAPMSAHVYGMDCDGSEWVRGRAEVLMWFGPIPAAKENA